MKWRKLGKILDFKSSPFAQRFVSHMQSPQAIEFDDFVRVYFTTRKKDTDTTFISHPQYADFKKDFSEIIDYSKKEIISRGKLGCFDEHGIFPFSPVIVGEKIYAYTHGWTRRVSVDVDSSIGLAIAENCGGGGFQRFSNGPVLGPSLYEPFLVGDPFVRFFDNKFYMFYIFGKKWSEKNECSQPERVYKISYATSEDGINWEKSGKTIIEDTIGEDECQALPSVLKIGNRYHMYFCYRDMFGFRTHRGRGYRLGYAYSDDLKNWIRDDSKSGIELSVTGWDSEMMCYPCICEIDEKIYLLYNGNAFGRDGFGAAILEEI